MGVGCGVTQQERLPNPALIDLSTVGRRVSSTARVATISSAESTVAGSFMLVTSRWSVNDKRHVDADSSTLHTPLKSEGQIELRDHGCHSSLTHIRTASS